VLDALRLAGHPPPRHFAATEVAGHAAVAAGWQSHAREQPRRDHPKGDPPRRADAIRPAAPGLDELAGLVNVVTFAPKHADAGTATAVDAEQADRAAAQAVAYIGDLRSRRPWWRRLLWSADPRPLLWGRRTVHI